MNGVLGATLACIGLCLAFVSPTRVHGREPVYRGEFCWEKGSQKALGGGRLRLHVLSYGPGDFSVNGQVEVQTVDKGALSRRTVLTHGTATRLADRIQVELSLSSVFSPVGPFYFRAALDPASLGGTFEEQAQDIDSETGETILKQMTGTLTPVPCAEELSRAVCGDVDRLAGLVGL